MTSRFFHALVVVGAGISTTACGGKSEGTSGDDTPGNGVVSCDVIDPACDEALEGVILPGLAKLGIEA